MCADDGFPAREGRVVYLLDHELGVAREEVSRLVREAGAPEFRARQVWEWIFRRRVRDFSAMKSLPGPLRAFLAERAALAGLVLDSERLSADGTRKFLWRMRDGARVESVWIPAGTRITLCISSQVGCPLACTFCATGYMGLKRDLSSGEIAEQAIAMLGAESPPEGVNIVFMGMGEPLLNLDAVLGSVEFLNRESALGIGARRITISTAGIPEGILRMAEVGEQLRLAVSLHAANDALRSRLMPINRRHPLAALLGACREYTKRRRRRISFEYVQLPGVNDRPADVADLAALLGELPAKLNVIPFNEITQAGYRPPTAEETDRFVARLRGSLRQAVSLRQRRGDDVSAACGQLWAHRQGVPAVDTPPPPPYTPPSQTHH